MTTIDVLKGHNLNCSVRKLEELRASLLHAIDIVDAQLIERRKKVEELQLFRQKLEQQLPPGIPNLVTLLKELDDPALLDAKTEIKHVTTVRRGAASASRSKTGRPTYVRKPYMDPANPNSPLYAFKKSAFERNPELMPDWVTDRLNEGWKFEDLHYQKHASACKRLGIKPKYDAIARHNELQSLIMTERLEE